MIQTINIIQIIVGLISNSCFDIDQKSYKCELMVLGKKISIILDNKIFLTRFKFSIFYIYSC